jgi:hypothetical protein
MLSTWFKMSTNRNMVAILAVSAAAIVLIASVLGLLVANQTLNSTGTVLKTIGVRVFSDSACTNPVTSIDWGTLGPNSTTSKTLYVKNNGTSPETLSMEYGNWTPAAASSYMTFAWNATGVVIGNNAVAPARMTLTVASNIVNITSFSFDIAIIGTES